MQVTRNAIPKIILTRFPMCGTMKMGVALTLFQLIQWWDFCGAIFYVMDLCFKPPKYKPQCDWINLGGPEVFTIYFAITIIYSIICKNNVTLYRG